MAVWRAFDNNTTPAAPNNNDAVAYSLSTRFRINDANTYWVIGVELYFPTTLPSSPVEVAIFQRIDDATAGSLLASATFPANVTPGQRNYVNFTTPLQVSAALYPNDLYVTAWTPDTYVATGGYFSGVSDVKGPLTAPEDISVGDNRNGRFIVGGTDPTYPTGHFGAAGYWMSPVVTDQAPTSASPAQGIKQPRLAAGERLLADSPKATSYLPGQLTDLEFFGENAANDAITFADPSTTGSVRAGGSSESVAEGGSSAVDVADTSGSLRSGGSPAVATVAVTTADTSGSSRSGGSPASADFGIVVTDAPGSLRGGGSPEAVVSGVTVTDLPGSARSGGSPGAATIETLFADVPGGARSSGSPAEVSTSGSPNVTVPDTSGSSRQGGSPAVAVVAVAVADTSGSSRPAGTAANTVSAVVLSDTPGGARTAGSPAAALADATVTDTPGSSRASGSRVVVVSDASIIDTSGGGRAGGSATVSDVVVVDASGGSRAGGSGQFIADGEVVHDMTVMPVAQALLACLMTEVSKSDPAPANFSIRPGASFAAMISQDRDECCEGSVWVRVVSVNPTNDFPTPATNVTACGFAYWAIELEIGVIRCLPTSGPDGPLSIVTSSQWMAAANRVLDDAAAVRRAICCLSEGDDVEDVIWGTWSPLENEANCTGGTMNITVQVPSCECQET